MPEFRGLNRKNVPQWLLVVMHHSGLFDAWRLPIATGIAYFGAAEGLGGPVEAGEHLAREQLLRRHRMPRNG